MVDSDKPVVMDLIIIEWMREGKELIGKVGEAEDTIGRAVSSGGSYCGGAGLVEEVSPIGWDVFLLV